MAKVILILIDACGEAAARETAGYLEQLVANKKASRYCVEGGLPSLSRPMYESMLTGVSADEHGIVSNRYTRDSHTANLFSETKKQGLTNAAAAYGWISELYNHNGPFDMTRHRLQLESDGDIMHGIFYWKDEYPDSHTLMDGEALRQMYAPDFLFIHTMGADLNGHRHGCDSLEYRGALGVVFEHIAEMIDTWRDAGYDIVVTADHGMDAYGMHGGNTAIQRHVPLYIVSDSVVPGDYTDQYISYRNTAPLVCRLLGIEPTAGMLKKLAIKCTDKN